jgi:esterase/lipase
MIKPVTFKNQGQQLIGVLHVPDILQPRERAPAIIMFHGFTGNKSESHRLFVYVARALCDSGFVVFRFDFRGSGDSDGEFEDMSVPGEVSDAQEALTFMSNLECVDKEQMGVLGLSMGGRVAAILTSEDPRVKYVVLYSAALAPVKQGFLGGLDEESVERLKSGKAIRLNNGWYLKKPFFDTLDSPVPYDVMNKIKVPVLIIHGDADEAVHLNVAIRGYDIIKNNNEKNELHIVKGGDHVFSVSEHRHEVTEKTVHWLKLLGLEISKPTMSEEQAKMAWDYSQPWFHGSPFRFRVLQKGSIVTQDRALAKVFSHGPSLISLSDDGTLKHDGKKPGFLYRIAEDVTPYDVQPHPHLTMIEGKEWVTTRDLKVEQIGLTVIVGGETLTDAEIVKLKQRLQSKP